MTDIDYKRRKAVGEAAHNEAQNIASKSRLERLDSQIHQVNWEELTLGETIGYGGFSRVSKCVLHCEDEESQVEYALKCLNPTTMLKTKSFKTGAVDLALEGEILSRLSHENIIRLHGICSSSPMQSYIDSDRGYFLVLDLLKDTLSNRLEKYRQQKQKGFSLRSSRTNSSVLERVHSVGMGVAKGMECLHANGVVLRDLKPDNVGFDSNGVPKIFDLGFAREVHTLRPKEVAGSLRYMAPEVALGKATVLVSDVYSFGVLMWEICTLDKPYKHLNTRDEFMEQVIVGAWRHSTSGIQSTALRKLIKECWQTDHSKRPDFTKIVKVLRVETSLAGRGMLGSSKPHSSFMQNSQTSSQPSLSSNSLRRMNQWSKNATSKLSMGSKRFSNSSLGVLRHALGGSRSNSRNSLGSFSVSKSGSSLNMVSEEYNTETPSSKNGMKNATFNNIPAKTDGNSPNSEKKKRMQDLFAKYTQTSSTSSDGIAKIPLQNGMLAKELGMQPKELTRNSSKEKLTRNSSKEKLSRSSSKEKLSRKNSKEKLSRQNSKERLSRSNSRERRLSRQSSKESLELQEKLDQLKQEKLELLNGEKKSSFRRKKNTEKLRKLHTQHESCPDLIIE